MYVLQDRVKTFVIDCIPPGATAPANRQLFDWRYFNKKPVIDNDHFKVDVKTGILEVTELQPVLDGIYHCNIISDDESVTTFTHSIVSKFVLYASDWLDCVGS